MLQWIVKENIYKVFCLFGNFNQMKMHTHVLKGLGVGESSSLTLILSNHYVIFFRQIIINIIIKLFW